MPRLTCVVGRIESERLVLEPLRVEHAQELAPVLDDRSLHRFIGGEPLNVEQLEARVTRQIVGRSPDGREQWLNWTVRVRGSGQAVGMVQATVQGDAAPVAEIAWVIGVPYQRQGFAREAAASMASWLRAQGICGLRAHIHPEHHASIAVARAVGLAPTTRSLDGERRWQSPTASCPPGHGNASS